MLRAHHKPMAYSSGPFCSGTKILLGLAILSKSITVAEPIPKQLLLGVSDAPAKKLLCTGDLRNLEKASKKLTGKVKQLGWSPENFSDPRGFDPHQFRFIVKAIPGPSGRTAMPRITVKGVGQTASGELYNRLQNPEKLSEEGLFSGSLIDQDKRPTFADSGFILSVPSEAIFVASSGDIGVGRTGSYHGDLQHLLLLNTGDTYTVESVDEIMNGTGTASYNEVVMMGKSPDGKKVEVSGIFMMVDQNQKPFISDQEVSELEALAKAKSLPLLKISGKRTDYRTNKIEFEGIERPKTNNTRLAAFFEELDTKLDNAAIVLKKDGILHRLQRNGKYFALDEYGRTLGEEYKAEFLASIRQLRKSDRKADKTLTEHFPDIR